MIGEIIPESCIHLCEEPSWKAAQKDLFHIEYKPLTEEMQKVADKFVGKSEMNRKPSARAISA